MEKLKLLVVDDEPGIRSGINRILANFRVGFPFMEDDFEFDIIEAASGEEALLLVDEHKPDIILLDNKLPGIEGIEVLERISKKELDTIVMMITSYASLELAVKATSHGAYNFIPKPFTPQELRAAVESITKRLFLRRMTKNMHREGKQVRFMFLSVLSHELKSPLNAIEGYLRMMQEKELGDNIADYETMIGRCMERIGGMRNLIMDMLDLTKIESGKKSREIQEVNLFELIQISIDTMEPYAIQRNVSFKLDAPKNKKIDANGDDLEIIFNNLVSNAVKYNVDGGTVFVSIDTDETSLILKVQDTGIGITQEDLAKLFQEFVRIKNIKTRNISGSGLGLSIVKKLVDSYMGTIHVDSIPEKGTTFTVTMPLKYLSMKTV